MSFIDEAVVTVQAGRGGDGCASFLRARCLPKGGPNGGDGGKGGDVYLVAVGSPNTLLPFKYKRVWAAESGQNGRRKQCTGTSGSDLTIPVPVGTRIYEIDTHTNEKLYLGDLTQLGQTLLVAKGGAFGLGNVHFKSSINRAPRRITYGQTGEMRVLFLELSLLADVGLLGLPNAGKSSLIRAISSARPKIADYPFTTLRPYLGVVFLPPDQSFVVADIPGLIQGASQGHGLGTQFLKHLSRTQVLWHVVSLESGDLETVTQNIQTIEQELSTYDQRLSQREQWLILNKADLFLEEVLDAFVGQLMQRLNFKWPVFVVSATSKQGIDRLIGAWAKNNSL